MVCKRISGNFNHTIYASYIGYITQAIIVNFVPLLYLTFKSTYNLSLDEVGFLVTINFGVQLLTDFLAVRYVDKIGYRISVVAAHVFSVIGLVGIVVFPYIFSNGYPGLVLGVICYAIGGGIIEVLVSPIVEACPTERKEAAMSLLHSFYCWGHVFVVICSTIFFTAFGIENWRILACLWAIVPLLNSVYFSMVPIAHLVKKEEKLSVRDLTTNKIFWIFMILMITAGASEQAMSQWASAFAESGLEVSKAVGDLAGPCLFAVFMGSARVFYARFSERIKLERFIFISGVLCIVCYLLASLSPAKIIAFIGVAVAGLSVGILWPGTLSLASRGISKGGTAMFALLALAGDLGCSAGPGFVGVISEAFNEDLKKGILFTIVFPVTLLVALALYRNYSSRTRGQVPLSLDTTGSYTEPRNIL
jgi:MFS family permease